VLYATQRRKALEEQLRQRDGEARDARGELQKSEREARERDRAAEKKAAEGQMPAEAELAAAAKRAQAGAQRALASYQQEVDHACERKLAALEAAAQSAVAAAEESKRRAAEDLGAARRELASAGASEAEEAARRGEIDIAWLDHIDDGMECTTFTYLAKSLHKREVSNFFMGGAAGWPRRHCGSWRLGGAAVGAAASSRQGWRCTVCRVRVRLRGAVLRVCCGQRRAGRWHCSERVALWRAL
jgi:23S rRNA pseudoU1915 N3-methylase RlmH